MTLEELRNWLWADTDEQQMAVLQAVFTRLNQQMPAAAMLPPHVRIMSMHGAKGLSSPIVFVPGFAARANGLQQPEVQQIKAEIANL